MDIAALRARIARLDLAVLDSSSRGWDEMAVRLQPLLDVALRQSGAATDAEAFPRGSRSRRDWETRIAKPLGIGVTQGEKLPSGGYDITHGTTITGLQDGEGTVYWDQDTSSEQFASDIHTLLND